MRKVLGPVLTGLGGFLLATGLLMWLFVPGTVKKTPLNVNSTTKLTGQANVLPSGGSSAVKAVSYSVADGTTSDSHVVVFDNFTCVVKASLPGDCTKDTAAGSPLITASTDRFATDRTTALALQDGTYTEAGDKHDGLVNKFPFDVQKADYPIWDGLLGKAVTATFVGEETIDGLSTYKFSIPVKSTAAEISSGVQGTYSSDKTIWVDPLTGSFIKQSDHQIRKLANGTTVLDLELAFTPETVSKNVSDAKANGSKLGLIGTLTPIALVLGLISLVAGLVLARTASPQGSANAAGQARGGSNRDLDIEDLGHVERSSRRS